MVIASVCRHGEDTAQYDYVALVFFLLHGNFEQPYGQIYPTTVSPNFSYLPYFSDQIAIHGLLQGNGILLH